MMWLAGKSNSGILADVSWDEKDSDEEEENKAVEEDENKEVAVDSKDELMEV